MMKKLVIMVLVFNSFIICTFAKDLKVDKLLEKIQQSNNSIEKKKLLERLKIKLAKVNKKATEESNAIVKAKQKIPQNTFNENSIK